MLALPRRRDLAGEPVGGDARGAPAPAPRPLGRRGAPRPRLRRCGGGASGTRARSCCRSRRSSSRTCSAATLGFGVLLSPAPRIAGRGGRVAVAFAAGALGGCRRGGRVPARDPRRRARRLPRSRARAPRPVRHGRLPRAIVPLAAFNTWAFGSRSTSRTSTPSSSRARAATTSIGANDEGLFGLTVPSLRAAAELLASDKGFLVLTPLAAGRAWAASWRCVAEPPAARRTSRSGSCGAFLLYNSSYFLPFGGWVPGPAVPDSRASVRRARHRRGAPRDAADDARAGRAFGRRDGRRHARRAARGCRGRGAGLWLERWRGSRASPRRSSREAGGGNGWCGRRPCAPADRRRSRSSRHATLPADRRSRSADARSRARCPVPVGRPCRLGAGAPRARSRRRPVDGPCRGRRVAPRGCAPARGSRPACVMASAQPPASRCLGRPRGSGSRRRTRNGCSSSSSRALRSSAVTFTFGWSHARDTRRAHAAHARPGYLGGQRDVRARARRVLARVGEHEYEALVPTLAPDAGDGLRPSSRRDTVPRRRRRGGFARWASAWLRPGALRAVPRARGRRPLPAHRPVPPARTADRADAPRRPAPRPARSSSRAASASSAAWRTTPPHGGLTA